VNNVVYGWRTLKLNKRHHEKKEEKTTESENGRQKGEKRGLGVLKKQAASRKRERKKQTLQKERSFLEGLSTVDEQGVGDGKAHKPLGLEGRKGTT